MTTTEDRHVYMHLMGSREGLPHQKLLTLLGEERGNSGQQSLIGFNYFDGALPVATDRVQESNLVKVFTALAAQPERALAYHEVTNTLVSGGSLN